MTSFTIGEPMTVSNSHLRIASGFLQTTFLVKEILPERAVDVTYSISVFPNPTASSVHVTSGQVELNSADITLFDLNGKELPFQMSKEPDLQIDMSNHRIGVYYLLVRNADQLTKFKIIKKK